MGEPAHQRHHGDTSGDEQTLLDETLPLLVQQGKDIGQCDIDEAGCSNYEHVRQNEVSGRQGKIAQSTTEERAQTGACVGDESLGVAPAGIAQQDEVAHFLRDFMRDDGDGRGHTEHRVGDKGGGDQHTVDKIVEGIAQQNQWRRGYRCVMPIVGTAIAVRMSPKGQSLQGEETEQGP